MIDMHNEPMWKRFQWELFGKRPQAAAGHVLHSFKSHKVPIPVLGIIQKLGIEVYRSTSVSIVELDPTCAAPQITVNANEPWCRQRFAMSHALGHLLMHRPSSRIAETSFAAPLREVDVEANDFAAGLLMPMWTVEIIAGSKRRTTLELAEIFGVSKPAMAYQLNKMI